MEYPWIYITNCFIFLPMRNSYHIFLSSTCGAGGIWEECQPIPNCKSHCEVTGQGKITTFDGYAYKAETLDQVQMLATKDGSVRELDNGYIADSHQAQIDAFKLY